MKRIASLIVILAILWLPSSIEIHATEFHVAVTGYDSNPGTQGMPFRTIQHAANLAQPGDTITVHTGVYRERINPPRGGKSDKKRIVYQAAPGERVIISGSEVVTNWVNVVDDVWKTTLPNSYFGNFNPYQDCIHGDWFQNKGRIHHTGAVYLNGNWMDEATNLSQLVIPVGTNGYWLCQVDQENTAIWATFKGVNPNKQAVEINVRQTVFTPEKTGINYLTVRGFDMRNAATPWAPPSAGQFGIVSAYWCKGWIIEDNEISYSKCCGVALGKYSDEFDNTNDRGTADPYTDCVRRALTNGWNQATVGSHIVRNNHIHHCEQTGIVGSLGCSFSTITGNTIHDIHVRRLFSGAEMAGIKFHGAIDVLISGNHIYRTCRGIWLDWMAQGTRVSGNLFHNNATDDLFCEVDHGPYLVDNNVFLSPTSLTILSQGGAFVHNLIVGTKNQGRTDARQTPFHKAHSTAVVGLHNNPYGDDRYYNNLFVHRANLETYDKAPLPAWMEGNVFLQGARPAKLESKPLVKTDFAPRIKLTEKADGFYLDLALDKAWSIEQLRKLVTTKLLGKASIPNQPYENADGSKISIKNDYFGYKRNESNPFPGPFELPEGGSLTLKVWPMSK